MPQYSTPGVYVEEIPTGFKLIDGVSTSIAAFVGRTREGPVNDATFIRSFAEFERAFGGQWEESTLSFAVRQYFANGGQEAVIVRVVGGGGRSGSKSTDGEELTDAELLGERKAKTGMYALEDCDLFNLLCLPPLSFEHDVAPATWAEAAAYCEERRAFLLVDPPAADDAPGGIMRFVGRLPDMPKWNAALYYPHVRLPNPFEVDALDTFAPCGAVAGVIARTDLEHGVWKAPAGVEAALKDVVELAYELNDYEIDQLHPLAINSLRTFPHFGHVVWGARTLEGADDRGSEWKYIPVRRLALFIEESIARGTEWAVFEPNDEELWAKLQLNVAAFMNGLFQRGAFTGPTPEEAFLVECDSTTTTESDIDKGIVNIMVGFAPTKPGEFVMLRIQQTAGQVAA